MCPKNASYYGNRAATLMMLCRYREALEDCQQAVRLDNSFVKASHAKRSILSWGKSSYVLQYQQGCFFFYNCYNVMRLHKSQQLWLWFYRWKHLTTVCKTQIEINKNNLDISYIGYRLSCKSPYTQGHLREGKCHLSLGNAMAASRCFQRVLELEPDSSQAQQEVKLTGLKSRNVHMYPHPQTQLSCLYWPSLSIVIHYMLNKCYWTPVIPLSTLAFS